MSCAAYERDESPTRLPLADDTNPCNCPDCCEGREERTEFIAGNEPTMVRSGRELLTQ